MATPQLNNWDVVLAKELGVNPTPAVIRFFHLWSQAEGGGATNNPFNTTQPGFTATGNYNTVGVKNYADPMAGIKATAATLKNGRYQPILDALSQGQSAQQMAQALAGSPWGTGALVLKMLGAGGAAPPLTPAKTSQQALGTTVKPIGQGPQVQDRLTSLIQNAAPSELTQQLLANRDPNLGRIVQAEQAPIPMPKPLPIRIPNPDGGAVTVHGVDGKDPVALTAVKQIQQYVGTPYVWGGAKPGGFDCSGLLQYTWAQQGVQIPRTTYDQWHAGQAVTDLRPGDAVFFKGSDSRRGPKGEVLPGHVGMYIGNGKYIQSPHTGAKVEISNLADAKDYMGGRRFA